MTIESGADSTAERLRILLVSHVPLKHEFGGGRAQLELAEEFRSRGHHVETFDLHDAFPNGGGWRTHYLPNAFAQKAKRFVRAHAAEFDVIDAQQGDLPFEKTRLGFRGVLVVRSVGLYAFYRDFARLARARWPELIPGSSAAQIFARFRSWRQGAACRRSFQVGDVAMVPNVQEADYLRDTLKINHCLVAPYALKRDALEQFKEMKPLDAERQSKREVVFVGGWSLRKGSADWSAIVRQTLELAPDVTFRFLGTGHAADVVLRDIGTEHADRISVVSRYEWGDLAALLREGTVGALPSYAEGCPLGVVEQLAAGMPTVAYDVPGPRGLLQPVDPRLVVPPGDTARFAEAVVDILTMETESYGRLCDRCREAASALDWSDIAVRTLAAYRDRLAMVVV